MMCEFDGVDENAVRSALQKIGLPIAAILALIDIRLPDMEGTKLLSLMRESPPRMMKVILTGYSVLENAWEAISRGVDTYLTKPVRAETVLATVRELLKKQQDEGQFTQEHLRAYVASRFKEATANRRGTSRPEVLRSRS
jgi:YesN/AraC family two-component response regulator